MDDALQLDAELEVVVEGKEGVFSVLPSFHEVLCFRSKGTGKDFHFFY
jgi:hypothetical protein